MSKFEENIEKENDEVGEYSPGAGENSGGGGGALFGFIKQRARRGTGRGGVLVYMNCKRTAALRLFPFRWILSDRKKELYEYTPSTYLTKSDGRAKKRGGGGGGDNEKKMFFSTRKSLSGLPTLFF